MTEDDIRTALRDVIDPELGINIVDLGLVRRIDVDGDRVGVTMTMTSPACPRRDYLQDGDGACPTPCVCSSTSSTIRPGRPTS